MCIRDSADQFRSNQKKPVLPTGRSDSCKRAGTDKDNTLQAIYQDWKDGEITQQEYRDMKADYERQTSDISAVLTRLNAERAELANGVDNEHPALVAFMKYQNIEALNREILVELVDYIKVYENGNISVKFKFADELHKIAEYIEINTTEDTAVAG